MLSVVETGREKKVPLRRSMKLNALSSAKGRASELASYTFRHGENRVRVEPDIFDSIAYCRISMKGALYVYSK